MPGFFGAVGAQPKQASLLRDVFAAPWSGIETVQTATGILGGHAFPPGRALSTLSDGTHIVVDGEQAVYRTTPSDLFEFSGGNLALTAACKGNLALVELGGRWIIGAEWTGSFPLYYVHKHGGFAFSSRLGALGSAFPDGLDALALLEFLREGWILAGRSPYNNVRRLMPGQVVTYDPLADRVRVQETSRLWVGWETDDHAATTLIPSVEERLLGAVHRCVEDARSLTVMMSGGWDSRTLLAAAWSIVGADRLTSYSHGDLASRELGIAMRAARMLAVPIHQEPIDARIFDLDLIDKGFQRVENVVFPHWHRAGRLLAELGQDCVTAGVYGEVLGGHYGRAMTLRASAKIAAVLDNLFKTLQEPERIAEAGVAEVLELLRPKAVNRPWFLAETFWRTINEPVEQVAADFRADLDRLHQRGIATADQLVEAFISEHRGSQYITAQLQSCRANLDIALPFVDRDLLLFASRLPLPVKIHNTLNRALLLRQRPQLLHLPMAATLVPAAAPMLVQEGSRLVRHLWEDVRWWAHFASGGRVGEPHLAWVNFEFARGTTVLDAIVADLHWDGWDRQALQRCLDEIRGGRWPHPLHPISDVLMKIYTCDKLVR